MSTPTGYENASATEIHEALSSQFMPGELTATRQGDALYRYTEGLTITTYYTNLIHAQTEDAPFQDDPQSHWHLLRKGLGVISVTDQEAHAVFALPTDKFINQSIMGPIIEPAIMRLKALRQGTAAHAAVFVTRLKAKPLHETKRAEIPTKLASFLDDALKQH